MPGCGRVEAAGKDSVTIIERTRHGHLCRRRAAILWEPHCSGRLEDNFGHSTPESLPPRDGTVNPSHTNRIAIDLRFRKQSRAGMDLSPKLLENLGGNTGNLRIGMFQ